MTDLARIKAPRASAIDEVALLRREVEARLGRRGFDSPRTGNFAYVSRAEGSAVEEIRIPDDSLIVVVESGATDLVSGENP